MGTRSAVISNVLARTRKALRRCIEHRLGRELDLEVVHFAQYGKRFIKGVARVSPDAFLQLAEGYAARHSGTV